LWEIGALNVLIGPFHIPFLPRKFKVVEEGACVLLVFREGKGVRGKERSSREEGKGSYGAGFSVGT